MRVRWNGTHEIKDQGRESSKTTDETPVRLVHADGVAVGRVPLRRESPLERHDGEDGQEEAEDADEHRAREAGPGDKGRVGLCSRGVGRRVRSRDVP